MSRWREVEFSELCDITRGASPRPIKDFIADKGMPWVKIADATKSDSRFINETKERIKIEGVSKSKQVYPGDLILSNSATPGLPKFLKIEACIHDGWMLLRNFKGLNKRFAYWLLLHERKNLVMQGNGSVFTNLKTDILKNHVVKIPDEGDQKRIAGVLDSIQDKIELNRQTNQTLEQIAQAIFKSWFVDFEPVKAKIKAKQSLSPALTQSEREQIVERAAMCAISGKTDAQLDQLDADTQQQLKTTAALFPDALVDSELGEIPDGWEVTDLKSATTELRRGISPKYTEKNGIQVVNQKCIRNHSVNFKLTRLNDPLKRKVDGRQIEIGDVLVNSTGVGTLGRLALIRYLPKPTVFDSHVTVVRADEEVISKLFLAGLMLINESYIEASGAGSTGQTELRKEILQDIKFAKPSLELSMFFDGMAEPINKQIAELEQQQITLISIRNTLLPKLLSGELSTQAIKTTLSEAVE